jgi:hypothetical protein
MADPSPKADAIEDLLQTVLGSDRREFIETGNCIPLPVGCGGPAAEFRDDLSKKEYTITGLCQKCQDTIWTG